MLRGAVLFLGVFCLILSGNLSGQTLSTDVYASEDELYEAYLTGDLSWEEYRTLLELMLDGETPRHPFLFDEIPNIIFIDSLTQGETTPLKRDQAAGFVAEQKQATPHGTVRYRYSHLLEDEAVSGYRIDTDLKFNAHWRGSTRLYRDRYGDERVMARSVQYTNNKSLVRSVTIGSYNARLGLGTVIGRRGKLFDYSDELDKESWRYPDYGGFNGAKLLIGAAGVDVDLIGSVNHDSSHRLVTVGGMVSRQFRNLLGGLIFGRNYLNNRMTDSTLSDYKGGVYLSHHGRGLALAFEACSQFGDGGSSQAFLFEGKRTVEDATIKLAGWTYGADFINLSSGSKSAALSQRVVERVTEFGYRDRLVGQRGGLVETVLRLENQWELTSALVYGYRSFDSTRIEIMGSLRRIWSERFSVRADFLERRTKEGIGADNIAENRRVRLEARFNMGKTEARTYIAYQTPTRGADYWGWFARLSTTFARLGEFELWSNVGRITNDGIHYWYGYLRNMQPLTEKTSLTIKLSHSFSESRTDHHETAFSIELEYGL